MTKPHRMQSSDGDPERLRAGSGNASLQLTRYTAGTRAGQAATVAAWYRLSSALDESRPDENAQSFANVSVKHEQKRERTLFLTGVFTAACGLWLLLGTPAAIIGTDVASGAGGSTGSMDPATRGAGGCEGSTGARGSSGNQTTQHFTNED